jgi:hypothetical protein
MEEEGMKHAQNLIIPAYLAQLVRHCKQTEHVCQSNPKLHNTTTTIPGHAVLHLIV